jgi:hypothetical protein
MNMTEHVRIRRIDSWLIHTQRVLDPRDGIPRVVKQRGALSDWPALRSAPSGRAEDELSFSLQIAPAQYDHPLVDTCLRRVLEVIDAGANDERWETWWSIARDVEHGRFVSTGEFARAWLNNSSLNDSLLVSASAEVLRGALQERPNWTELAQCEYVDGVQLLIVAGQLEQATEKLQIRRRFGRVERYYNWNVRLLEILLDHPLGSEALRAHLEPYFDHVRDPTFHVQTIDGDGDIVFGVELLRLRLALIRWIYIERQPVAGNWRHIIGQIGY